MRTALLLCLLCGAGIASAQLNFPTKTLQFDTLAEGQELVYRFQFTLGAAGTGIALVTSSCDCATPAWPHQALNPGDTGSVEVRFHTTGKPPGPVDKAFTVYDKLRQPLARLRIVGYVKPRPASPPAKPAVELRFTETYAYDLLRPDTTTPNYAKLARTLQDTAYLRYELHIEASASLVPTASFADNNQLAARRGQEVSTRLERLLAKRPSTKKATLKTTVDAKVQGPAPGLPNPAVYRKYQYVKATLRAYRW